MKRIALTFVLAASIAATLPAQQPATSPPVLPGESVPPGLYVGVASCVNAGCHGATEPLNATRVLQNEFYTWLNDDRHAGAYNILFNDRSARIARNMRLRKRAYEEAVCLDCHTTNVPASRVAGQVDPEDGVQCEMCHGPASGWRGEHTEEGWTHARSVERGMIDLRRIETRARVCLPCHAGNGQKEVDHELIAAGHPVLAFELDNYTASMPPHWTANRDTHGARAWAVGQVVKFGESMENVARHARGEKWPEFSDMSCFDCHHALKSGGWRQERGWPDRAGLPSWSPQNWAVLRLLIGRVAPAARDELDPIVARLARGVSRMSDGEGIASSAEHARRIVTPLIARIESLPWSESDVRATMRAIAGDPLSRRDVQTAEQAALSLQSLASVLTRRNPRLLRSPMMRSIDALFEDLKIRDDYDAARFAAKLEAVRAAVE
jgi:hypothetical protein